MIPEELSNLANVPNLDVHKLAGIKKDKFLERIMSVEAIRRFHHDLSLTWYPTTVREWTLWEGLHNAVNKGDFGHTGMPDDYYPFGLILTRPLYNLLSRNDLSVIQRQIVAYLAAVLAYDPDAEKFIPDQVFPPVAEQARIARAELFPSSFDPEKYWSELMPEIQAGFNEYTGTGPFEFLDAPIRCGTEEVKRKWWIRQELHLGYVSYYFTPADWKSLIVEKKQDSLLRSKSDKLTWDAWLHTYKLGSSTATREISFFADPGTRGTIYVIQQSDSDYYKIGWTSSDDPSTRLASLQTGSPQKLILRGHFSASSQNTETVIHKLFSLERESGEWFRLSQDQVDSLLSSEWRREQQVN